MDTGVYDVIFDGETLVGDRPHGVTDRGIGSVLVGAGNDADLDRITFVDNPVMALDGDVPAGEESWGAIKGTYSK